MGRQRQQAKSEASMEKAMDAALGLFSEQGFRASTMREIAERAGISMGNLYHHFPNKDSLFERLFERYWERLLDPELELNKVFAEARFPEDLERMAAAIEQVVEDNIPYILLIYVDVIEFRGRRPDPRRHRLAGLRHAGDVGRRAAQAGRRERRHLRHRLRLRLARGLVERCGLGRGDRFGVLPSARWRFAVNGKNLADEEYLTRAGPDRRRRGRPHHPAAGAAPDVRDPAAPAAPRTSAREPIGPGHVQPLYL